MLFRGFRDDEESVSVGSEHAGCARDTLDVDVLMAMEKPPWMGARHVAVEGCEADVNIVVPVMDHAWRVMGNEYIHRRERGERFLYF